jgi:hypothetical protein
LNPVTGLLDVDFQPTNNKYFIQSVNVVADNSKEGSGGARNFGVGAAPAPDTTTTALIDFSGEPSGRDQNGSPSVFQSSIVNFGTGTVLASSDVLYNSLSSSNQNLAGVLTATYDQLKASLPSSLQPNLVLDLPDDQITFAFPSSITYGGADSYSSDLTTVSSAGNADLPLPPNLTDLTFSTFPEPSSIVLLGLGTLGLLGYSRRRRKKA